jgi:hypothetical protein
MVDLHDPMPELMTIIFNIARSRDTLDLAAKFNSAVTNGKVFVAGQTQHSVFGLLP